jgi:hypothetical protein
MKENLMLHKIIITITVLFIAGSAIAELLFPSEMLTFVGIPSNQQTDFLLRTTAVALLSLLPSLWSARDEANLSASRNALFGIAAYMFLSSAVDYQAFAQGVINSMSVPSVALRVLWGIGILWLTFRGASK